MALSGRNPLAKAVKIEQNSAGDILVRDAVTAQQSAETLYARWRKLEHLPDMMTHLQRVGVLDGKRSRWTVKAPVGEVSWDAELTADEPVAVWPGLHCPVRASATAAKCYFARRRADAAPK